MRTAITRREFLDRTAGAAAVAAVAGRDLFAARASGMYISLNSACVHNDVGWPGLAKLAADVGFGGVDWNLNSAMTAGLDQTKQLFADLTIKPAIVNLPSRIGAPGAGRGARAGGAAGAGRAAGTGALAAAGAPAPAAPAPAVPAAPPPTLDDSAAFASAVGCRKMMAVLPTTASDTTPLADFRKMLRDQIAGYAETLAKYNMRLGLEFLGPLQFRNRPNTNVFIYTLPECVAFAKECGPNVGAVLDVWHWHHSGGTAADILATDKSRIVQIHLSDAKDQPPEDVRDNQRLMPGEGIIDYNVFFGALKQIGYDDSVSPEPLGRVPMEMSSADGAKLALQTTTAVMKKAGAI